MTKFYCDVCGKEIYYDFDGVNLNFNNGKQYELCVNCAKRVQGLIKKLKEYKENDKL